METKIIIDSLTMNSVSVVKQKVIIDNGVEYSVGIPSRCCYMNSTNDRKRLENDISEKYVNAIFSVWGDNPTVEEATE